MIWLLIPLWLVIGWLAALWFYRVFPNEYRSMGFVFMIIIAGPLGILAVSFVIIHNVISNRNIDWDRHVNRILLIKEKK
jgi:hypothetical protein